MNIRNVAFSRVLLPLAIAALPAVLLYSSIRTFHELDEQRQVYLRHRVSVLAARLEYLPAAATPDDVREALSEEEPSLLNLAVISRGGAQDTAELAAIWNGRELFRTELVEKTGAVFRAYVPFHSGEGLRIARIDLDPAAADFLLVHARHNVIIASAGGLVLLALSIYSLWSMRRAARLRERQLEIEQLARIGKMAAALAHEIRNPLGTIKGFVQLAGERVDAATKNLLRPAIVETERLERLVTDLLTYSRPPTPAPAPAEWDDVALRLEAHGRHLIGERPIALSISRSGFTWNTDAGLVEQALLNLLRNAIEAIPQNTPGEVRIEFEQRGADIVISVEDTGAGLSDNARTRIFEPFFTTKASGTGLGLAITRGLVSSLGGRLELHGRETGGTRAVMTFPQVAAIAAGAVN